MSLLLNSLSILLAILHLQAHLTTFIFSVRNLKVYVINKSHIIHQLALYLSY